MKAPHFSIICPVHNAEVTIVETVRSVLAQTLTDFEIVVIDDGSTDQSLKLLLALAAHDTRIRLISQANAGVSAARNFGVSQCRGEWVAFLDADDIWQPRKLAEHDQFHRDHPEVDISFARIAFLSDATSQNWARATVSAHLAGFIGVESLLGENPVCTMSNVVAYRPSLERIGGFQSSMSFAEDQEWLIRAVSRGLTLRCIDAVLVGYRLSQDGLSVNLEHMYQGWRAFAQTQRTLLSLERAEAVYCRYLSRRALRAALSPSTALGFAARGLRLDAGAFLADGKRGWMTLIAVLASFFLPRRARLRLFA